MQTTDLECFDWYDMACDKFALKISDITKLQPGDKMDVLVLDRNVWDIALNKKINKPGVSYNSEIFFQQNSGTYVHNKDLSGKMVFCWDDDEDEDENNFNHNFEFDIEYKPNKWYPLKNGVLPDKDPSGFCEFPWQTEQHWTNFPVDTKIGYRGPMIPWSKLKEMSNIYWKNEQTKKHYLLIDFDYGRIENKDLCLTDSNIYVNKHFLGYDADMAAKRCFNDMSEIWNKNNRAKLFTFTIQLCESDRQGFSVSEANGNSLASERAFAALEGQGDHRGKIYKYSMTKKVYDPESNESGRWAVEMSHPIPYEYFLKEIDML